MQLLTGQQLAARQEQAKPYWLIGLDLGQSQDYTAIAVLRAAPQPEGKSRFECGHLERVKLGTPYPAIVEAVTNLTRRPEVGDWQLIVDATGVGRPVVDLFRDALPKAQVKPITITSSGKATSGGYGLRVPKRDLVTNLQVLLETSRLRFASALLEIEPLVQEVLAFQVKISDAGHDTYGSWRSGSHDDLVLAVALAAWYGERRGRRPVAQSQQLY